SSNAACERDAGGNRIENAKARKLRVLNPAPSGLIADPDWRGPRQLPVLLFEADVVVARPRARLVVHPGEIHLGLARRGGVDDLVVLDDDHLRDRAGAGGADLQAGSLAGGELVPHQVVAAADVEDDVVGGAVAVAASEGIEDRRAGRRFGKGDGV